MPIRINLLAETQALEDLRRRDPVKRVILAGILLVGLVLAWSVWLMGQTMVHKGELANFESRLNSRTNEYRQILFNKAMLDDGRLKLDRLHLLASSRFLVGTLLNELQKTTVTNVQLVRFRISQSYVMTEEVKPKAEGERVVPRPASAIEKIGLTLNAKDTSPGGEAVNEFQKALSAAPYFRNALGKMNEFRLLNVSTPQPDPEGKLFRLCTLEAQLPDKRR